MTTKRYRKSSKSKELTYEDIKGLDFNSLSPEELEQYGLGSWLKNNASTIGKVTTIAGTVLSATGVGAGIGAGLMAAGAATTAYGNKVDAEKAQNEQTAKMQAAQNNNIALQELQQEMSDNPLYSGVMKYGGTLNYGGQLHEGPNGGVPVDAMGNPNQVNPVALVEKGEVSYNTPDGGTYIYSDTLKYDKGKTFAKKAKDVQRRYKFRMKDGVINDPFAKKSYDNEMLGLMDNQEELRDFQNMQKESLRVKKYGGDLPMLGGGGWNPDDEPKGSYNWALSQNPSGFLVTPVADTAAMDEFVRQVERDYPSRLRTKMGSSTGVPSGVTQQMKKDLVIIPNLVKPVADTAAMDEFVRQVERDYSNSLLSLEQDVGKDVGNLAKKSNPQLYQGMNWAETGLAAAAPVLGGITGLILNNKRKAPANLKLSRMTPQQISLERRRAAARESAGVATSNLSRALKGASPTAGSYMSNVVAGITDIDRNLSNTLGESYTQEELQNAQLRQQADAANLDIDMQEQMYNSQLQNQFDASKEAARNAYLSQIAGGITGGLSQKFQSEKDADYLNMLNPNYELVVTGRGLNRKRYYRPRT